jgi:APA family basic amino acid/polyamine antiporter
LTESQSSVSAETPQMLRVLGLYSAAAIVVGSMIGSGIFLVTPEAARYVGTSGWLIALWVVSGVLTLLGASSYAKLAAYLPEAGGQYVFLREAWGRLIGFLYGWVLFLVIQTGFLAAVAVAFARYVGVLVPSMINTQPWLTVGPLHISTEQVLACAVLVGLTTFNTLGVKLGALLQNVFTSLKVLSLLLLLGVGLLFGHNLAGGQMDWSFSLPPNTSPTAFITLFAMAAVGPLFSADAWNYVTFIGGEVKNPTVTLPRALQLGTLLVVVLYILVNLGYLNVLTLDQIQHVPDDKVAAAVLQTLFGGVGAVAISLLILISTFGCLNGLVLSGARVFYAMAKDGLMFEQFGHVHPTTRSPNFSLWAQLAWALVLTLSGTFSQLLAYIVFTALVFYIITIAGLWPLAKKSAGSQNAVKLETLADKVIPIAYIAGALVISAFLLFSPDKWFTSVMGVVLTLTGVPVYFFWAKKQAGPAVA